MLRQEAVYRFADRQKQLLRQTYDLAWTLGVKNYRPDPDPLELPKVPRQVALAGLRGAPLLAARRRYPYEPPPHPDPVRRAIALAPSFQGLAKMVTSLQVLTRAPSYAQISAWIESNGYRLGAGDSVAWAGEQAGYAEAADADGMYIYQWESAGDTRVCPDCELLASFPPMPLSEWPTSPGAGDTACSVGCRCTWSDWGVPPSQGYSPVLSAEQYALGSRLAATQAEALHAIMADVAYLE